MVISLTEENWLIIALGLVLGIQIGIALLLFLTTQKSTTAKSAVPTYSNLEEWEFIRDPNTGRTKGLRVKRTAKEVA
jgi:hypothetical protein